MQGTIKLKVRKNSTEKKLSFSTTNHLDNDPGNHTVFQLQSAPGKNIYLSQSAPCEKSFFQSASGENLFFNQEPLGDSWLLLFFNDFQCNHAFMKLIQDSYALWYLMDKNKFSWTVVVSVVCMWCFQGNLPRTLTLQRPGRRSPPTPKRVQSFQVVRPQ